METLLFVGLKEKAYPVVEVAESQGIQVKYLPPASHIKKQMNDIIEQSAEWIVYDISEYIDEPVDVAATIRAIYNTTNAKVIIYAIGYSIMSIGIKMCAAEGFQNFVLTYDLNERKEEIRKCLNGFYEANSPEFLDIIKDDIKNIKHEYTTIALAGCCERIGTTTQAIQIVKYFMLMGHSACYIQMNDSEYVENIVRYYEDVPIEQNLGKVTYNNVDMYFNLNRLPEILNMDYEYYIYDFGVFNQGGFNKISFLEKNIKIVVGGAKVNELAAITRVLEETYLTDIKYIFSFIEDNSESRREILELMEEKALDTYFAPYAPELFKIAPEYDIYTNMLPCENLSTEKDIKKKRWPKVGFPFGKKK